MPSKKYNLQKEASFNVIEGWVKDKGYEGSGQFPIIFWVRLHDTFTSW